MSLTTSIIRLPETIFYQAIDHFQGNWAASVSTLMESCLMHSQTTSPRMAEHLHSTRLFSNVINTGWLAWDCKQLFKNFYAKDSSVLNTGEIHPDCIVFLVGMVVGSAFNLPISWKDTLPGLARFGQYIQKKFFHEKTQEFLDGVPAEKRDSVTTSFESPLSQVYGQAIYVTRIVMNLVTAYFSSEQRLGCIINAAGLTYNLLKTKQLKWLKFSRAFEYPRPQNALGFNELSPKRFLFSYSCPLFSNPSNENACMICLDDNPSFCFCPYAPIDGECLVTTIYNASNDFDKNLNGSYKKIIHTRGGNKVGSIHHADIAMPQKNLPKCPHCKNYPSSHLVEGEYWDWNINKKGDGLCLTDVHVIPDPSASPVKPLLSESFWVRLGIFYNTFKLGLATMQHRHPELAGKILSTQRVLSIFDAGQLIQNYVQLCDTFYQRYVLSWVQEKTPRWRLENAEQRFENARLEHARLDKAISEAIDNGTIVRRKNNTLQATSEAANPLLDQLNQKETELHQAFLEKEEAQNEQAAARSWLEETSRISLYVVMGLGAAALAATSAGVVSLIYRMSFSAFNLTDILKKIAAPEDIGNIKASSNMPWLEYTSQCVLVSNIVVNLALAFFSTHRFSYLSTALLQTLTFLKVSKLLWIVLEKSFSYPIKNLQASFRFLSTPFSSGSTSSSSTAASYVESSLKAAYDYTTGFFKNSTKNSYWRVDNIYGMKSRKLVYAVTINSNLVKNVCKVVPFLDKVSAWIPDSDAVVNLQ